MSTIYEQPGCVVIKREQAVEGDPVCVTRDWQRLEPVRIEPDMASLQRAMDGFDAILNSIIPIAYSHSRDLRAERLLCGMDGLEVCTR